MAYKVYSEKKTAKAEETEIVFSDPAGYEFTLPIGWTLYDKSKSGKLIRADITKGNNSGIQIRLTKCKAENFENWVNKSIEKYKTDMSQHHKGEIKETDRENVNIGDGAVSVSLYAKWASGKEWYFQEVFILFGDKVVIMQGGALWANHEGFASEFCTIAESFKSTK